MIKVIFRMIVLTIILVTLTRCDDYEFPQSPYPRIETLPVVNISESAVTFQANITQLGKLPITSHGFVWGIDENLLIESNNRIQQGATESLGNFKVDVKGGMDKGKTYFVKAFVATNDYFVYGDAVSFTSKGSTPPLITSFSPRAATVGDTIIIRGRYFSGQAAGNDVKFGTVGSKVIASNDSTIYCIVPNNIPNTAPIFVAAFGKETQSSEDFTLKDAWIRKADLPLSNLPNSGPRRYAASAFSINGVGYAGLGGDGIDNAFFKFDSTQNTWSTVAPYPGGARGYAASFVIDGKGYVGMGKSAMPNLGNGVAKSDFWRFNQQTNSWESVASIPYTSGIASYGFSRNGKGYVVTNSQYDNFWQYDPTTDTWEKKGDIPLTSHRADCGFVVDDRIFIIAGDPNASYSSQMWEYDFTTNTWSQRTGLPNPSFTRYTRGSKGFSLNGYGYVKFWNYLFKYNPNTDSWQDLKCPANLGGSYPIEFVIGNKIYYGTGNNVGVDIWEYDPRYQR